jgi:L-fuculose-phosphate aldolase
MNTLQTRGITHPSDQLISAMECIYSHKMTATSGGNLSSLDEEGSSWITQSMIARQEE